MIGTISIECNAKNPNMPLHPLRAYINSPSSLRITNVPRKIGKWNINKVTIVAIYPDSTSQTAECVLTGGVWVGTIEGSTTAGTLTQGYTILADGVDENGNDVTGYVLGKGDVEIMQSSSTPEPEPSTTFVRLQDDGTGAKDGVMYPTENGYMIQQNGEPHLLGTPFDQITAYVDTQVSSKAEISDVEDLSNSLSNYYTKSETSSNVELNTKFDMKADLSTLTTKADVSALNTKRGIYDLELYADSVLDAPYYAVNVKYADVQETAMDVLLKKMSGSTSLWVWQSGDGKSISLQKAGASTWMFTYQNLEDLSQNPQSSIFSNFSIDYPTQTLVLADSYFRFEIKSYAGMIASQDYVNVGLTNKVDLSATVDKALISQKLVNNLSDEHSTRVVVDEYNNVIVQKYIQSGWYSKVFVDGVETQDYWNAVTRIYDYPTDARVVDVLVQDKQRTNNPIVVYTHGTKSETEYTISADYYGTTLSIKSISSDVPMWTNIARLVPDNGPFCGLRSSILYNDNGFVTSAQIHPGYGGNAAQADMAIKTRQLAGTNGLLVDPNNTLWIPNGVPTLAHYSYYPWYLSQYYATAFDPAIEMNFNDWGTIQWKVGRRLQSIYIGPAWGSTTVGNERYFLLAETNDEGETYTPTGTLKYLSAGVAPTNKTVTFSANNLSVETIEGESGQIACARVSSGKMTELYPLAFESEVSAKADLSAIPTKTSELSNDSGFIEQNGTAVINSLTCDQLVANQAHIIGYATVSDLSTKRDLNDMTVKGIPPNAQQSRFNITDGTITNNAYWYDEGRWESGQTFAVYTTLTADVYELKKYDNNEWVSVGTFSLDSNYEATITNDGTTYSIIGYAGDLVVNTELSSYATKSWVMEQLAALSVMLQGGN